MCPINTERLDIQADSDQEELETKRGASGKEKAADRRNRERVEQADASDQKVVCKYLPPIEEFLPSNIPGPDDHFVPPAWLMEAIQEALESDPQHRRPLQSSSACPRKPFVTIQNSSRLATSTWRSS